MRNKDWKSNEVAHRHSPGLVQKPCWGSQSFPHIGTWHFAVTNHIHALYSHCLFLGNCVTQLKLDTGEKLSSPIFCCLSVCQSGIGVTRPNLHFFQYIQAYKPFADHVPPNIKQYQLILTKHQPVSSYTDPVRWSWVKDASPFDVSIFFFLSGPRNVF